MDDLHALAALLSPVRDAPPGEGILTASQVAAARDHGIGPLLYNSLHATGEWSRQSAATKRVLGELAARAALVEQLRTSHLCRVIEALRHANVQPLLFKGTALAHRHYPEPWLRPRVDTDLLIKREDERAVAQIFEQLDLVRAARPRGEHVTHQQTYQATVDGVVHEYDVHWKMWDPQVFSDAFTYDELAAASVPLPALGGAAAAGDVHALVIACVHRVAHHFDARRLLWVYDIDAVARKLTPSHWNAVAALVADKRLRSVCARGLALAVEYFHSPVPAAMMAELSAAADDEPAAAYLGERLRRVDILRSDLQALGWRGRAALLREHLFPEPSYILRSYGRTERVLLPALYLHRIVRGAAAWFRPLR